MQKEPQEMHYKFTKLGRSAPGRRRTPPVGPVPLQRHEQDILGNFSEEQQIYVPNVRMLETSQTESP